MISFFFLTTPIPAKAFNGVPPSSSSVNPINDKIDSLSFEELYSNNMLSADSFFLNSPTDSLQNFSLLSFLARYYFNHSRFDDARLAIEQILIHGEEEKDWKAMATAHNFGSLVAELEEQYMDVYFHNKKLLEFGEKYDPLYSAMAYLNQGNLFSEQGLQEEALKMYQAGLTICEKMPPTQEYGWLLYRIGECYQAEGSYELAKSHLQDALNFWDKLDNKRSYSFTLLQLGKIEQDLKNTDEARKLFLQTLQLTQQNDFWLSQVVTLISVGYFEMELGLYDKAIEYLEQATAISIEKKIPFYFKKSYAALAKAYQATGQIYKANSSYQEYLGEIDKNLKSGEETTTAWARNMDILYEKELAFNSLKEIEQEQSERLRIQRFSLYLSVALLSLIGWTAFSFFRSNKRIKKQKEILSHKNQKIKQQAEDLKIANENILYQKKELEVKLLKNLLQLSKNIESKKELSEYLASSPDTKDTIALKKYFVVRRMNLCGRN